ncbi:hypothetical protein HMPREF9141_1688 [Prevotella multiformis DSM 16608]|uniref:Uncharacterized protein n=1 Tax=Prevotella multiformis DSM 16608 TaxID=888743 RepID=F0F7X1_9BACT|nr:hypothetical protein HMPREF9141_1688 [Prevotella multiformis DSM 16608]
MSVHNLYFVVESKFYNHLTDRSKDPRLPICLSFIGRRRQPILPRFHPYCPAP